MKYNKHTLPSFSSLSLSSTTIIPQMCFISPSPPMPIYIYIHKIILKLYVKYYYFVVFTQLNFVCTPPSIYYDKLLEKGTKIKRLMYLTL